MNKPTVAFLGTGIMGFPMSINVARGGFAVRAWNRSAARTAGLAQHGIVTCEGTRSAVTCAEFVILMVSTGEVADEILFGVSGLQPGIVCWLDHAATVIVMSSIPVATARMQAERLASRAIRYLDAPVSGGQRGAETGELTILVGGDADTFAAAQPLLATMGRPTLLGPAGSGQLAKLANQTIVGISIAAVAEGLLLAQRGGVQLPALLDALRGGFADSTVLRQHGARMSAAQFEPGAHATTQLKDLRTAEALAREIGIDVPTLAHVRALFESMCAAGHGALDHSALFKWLAERSRSADG